MEILLFNLVRRQRKLHMFLGNNNCAVCQELLFNGPLATSPKCPTKHMFLKCIVFLDLHLVSIITGSYMSSVLVQ